MARKVVLAGACRTAIGVMGGQFANTSAVELGTIVIKEALKRAGVSPDQVDEVYMGNVIQAGNGQNPARQAAVYAGIPNEVPATTINVLCGSGLHCVNLAAKLIAAGDADIIVAGGMENMTMAPYMLRNGRYGYRMGNATIEDAMIKDGLTDAFHNYHMGITAENICEQWGLTREEFRFQNIYQSGYFILKEDGSVDVKDFREWDMGFDFYAPQTFTDVQGRRILIGWMGMPDAEEEYTNKTIDEGWQHCLTVPRELRVKDGKIFQYPAKELERLRKEKTILDDEKSIVEVRVEVNEGFDLLIEDIAVTDRSFQISMGGQMLFKYENEIAEIGFSEIAGAGRNKRKAKVSELNNIRILADTSAVELYLNDGEIVFSTRYYPDREDLQLKVKGGKFRGNLWNLRKMIFTK